MFDSEEDVRFEQIGVSVGVLRPGEPNCMYHGEGAQEDFLVLSGECLLVVEGEERRLKAWDFVHCPPWTEHVFIGAGEGPVPPRRRALARRGAALVYPVNETALRHGAGVEEETTDPTSRTRDSRDDREVPLTGRPSLAPSCSTERASRVEPLGCASARREAWTAVRQSPASSAGKLLELEPEDLGDAPAQRAASRPRR